MLIVLYGRLLDCSLTGLLTHWSDWFLLELIINVL